MSAPPPNLSLREEQAIARWLNDQQNGSVTDSSPSSSTCRCGAWMRSDLTGTTRCARSEAVINRHGEPAGGVCEGFADHRDRDRTLLLATVCGLENVIVGVVRVRRRPFIVRCQLCEWVPDDQTSSLSLQTHLVEFHNLDVRGIAHQSVLFVETDS